MAISLETLMAIKSIVKNEEKQNIANRVTSLNPVNTVSQPEIIEIIGIPTYISELELSNYSEYEITETGWYYFARVNAKSGYKVTTNTSIVGAAGYITPALGDTYIDIAVKFEVAAMSRTIIIEWDTGNIDTIVFKATDLAVRNMDYRVTFYQYDLAPYCTYTWQLASGTFNTATKSYYTLENGVYTKQTVTNGQSIPANTYYTHASCTISGFVKNISYMLDEIDCPVIINLPTTEENYGAWFEVQTNFRSAYSLTLSASSPDKVSGNGVQSPKAGVNIINLMYHKPTRTWLPTVTNWAAAT